jgi:hypothetical protein
MSPKSDAAEQFGVSEDQLVPFELDEVVIDGVKHAIIDGEYAGTYNAQGDINNGQSECDEEDATESEEGG